MKFANDAFFKTFQTSSGMVLEKCFYDMHGGVWNNPELLGLLDAVFVKNEAFDSFAFEYCFPDNGQRKMLLNAHRLPGFKGQPELLLLAIDECR